MLDAARTRGMMGRIVAVLLLVAALLGVPPGAAVAARPDAFEIRGRAGSPGEHVKASFKDGVLEVRIPKTEGKGSVKHR
jgi:hypothetical protein